MTGAVFCWLLSLLLVTWLVSLLPGGRVSVKDYTPFRYTVLVCGWLLATYAAIHYGGLDLVAAFSPR